ncbi:protogenin-like [Glandiceps talaboti]
MITSLVTGHLETPSKERYTILSSGVLHIHNIQINDEGDYRCVAENIVSRRRSDEGRLTVQQVDATTEGNEDLERKPRIVAGPQNVTMMVGSTVVMECLVNKRYHSDLQPVVTWSLEDGTEVINSQEGNNLEINELETSDSGVYVCTAENPTTGVQVKAKGILQVHEPPTIVNPPEYVARPAAATARFRCEAKGVPKPTITWLKNGEPVYLNGRIRTITEDNGELLISSVRNGKEDSGIYECIAENFHGRVQASARLKVNEVKGKGPSPPQNLKGFPLSSTEIFVSWNASSTADPKDLPIIAYTVQYEPMIGGRALQAAVAKDITEYTIDDLLPNTNYSIYVTAYIRISPSDDSKFIYVKTLQDVPDDAPVFTLSSDSPNSIKVTWEPLAFKSRRGEITKYTIYYNSKNNPTAEDSVKEVSGNVNENILYGLEPNTMYNIKMSASTSAGEGPTSVYNTKKTSDHIDVSIPTAPVLVLKNINSTAILVKWSMTQEAPVVPVQGFNLYYGISGSAPLLGPYDVGSDRSDYIIGDLMPSTRYVIKLLAYNQYGPGNDVSGMLKTQAHVPDDPEGGVPTAPIAVTGEVRSSTSALVIWQKPPQYFMEITYYTVRYQPNKEHNATFVRKELSEITEILLSNLMPYTTYVVDVRAHGPNSVGPYSNMISITTFEDKPSSPPRIVKVAVTDIQSVLLQWAPPEHPNGIITTYIILYNMNEIEPEDNWMIDLREGSEINSTIKGLQPSLMYYFKMKARTDVGAGPATDPIAVIMPPSGGDSSGLPKTGIIIGVSIGIACIIICLIIIVYRARKGLFPLCKPQTCNVPVPVCNSHIPSCHGNRHVQNYGNAQTEVELESFTPMLTHLPEPTNLDTKGGNGTLINGYGPVGCQSNGYLPQSYRLQHQLPGNSNTSIPVSTSSSSAAAVSRPGDDRDIVTESLNTTKMIEGNSTLLTDISYCHSGDDEDPPGDVTTHITCNAAHHDRNSSDTEPLPQHNVNCSLSHLPACHIMTDLQDQTDINQQGAALLQKSSTQGHHGNTGVNHCHTYSDSTTSPLLCPAVDNVAHDSGIYESNLNSKHTSSADTVWERRPFPVESEYEAHLNNHSGSESEEERRLTSSELSNTQTMDNSESKNSQDTSPHFIEFALNM